MELQTEFTCTPADVARGARRRLTPPTRPRLHSAHRRPMRERFGAPPDAAAAAAARPERGARRAPSFPPAPEPAAAASDPRRPTPPRPPSAPGGAGSALRPTAAAFDAPPTAAAEAFGAPEEFAELQTEFTFAPAEERRPLRWEAPPDAAAALRRRRRSRSMFGAPPQRRGRGVWGAARAATRRSAPRLRCRCAFGAPPPDASAAFGAPPPDASAAFDAPQDALFGACRRALAPMGVHDHVPPPGTSRRRPRPCSAACPRLSTSRRRRRFGSPAPGREAPTAPPKPDRRRRRAADAAPALTINTARVDGAGSHRRRYYGHGALRRRRVHVRRPSAVIISDGPAPLGCARRGPRERRRRDLLSRNDDRRPATAIQCRLFYGVAAARLGALLLRRGRGRRPCRAAFRSPASRRTVARGGRPWRNWPRGARAVVCDAAPYGRAPRRRLRVAVLDVPGALFFEALGLHLGRGRASRRGARATRATPPRGRLRGVRALLRVARPGENRAAGGAPCGAYTVNLDQADETSDVATGVAAVDALLKTLADVAGWRLQVRAAERRRPAALSTGWGHRRLGRRRPWGRSRATAPARAAPSWPASPRVRGGL